MCDEELHKRKLEKRRLRRASLLGKLLVLTGLQDIYGPGLLGGLSGARLQSATQWSSNLSAELASYLIAIEQFDRRCGLSSGSSPSKRLGAA